MNQLTKIPLIQDIVVDVTESQLAVIYANQYDDNVSTVRCHIQDHGVDLDISDYAVTLRVKKNNGKGFSAIIGSEENETGMEGCIRDNIVSFKIPRKITLSPGRQICDLEFFTVKDKKAVIKYSCSFYLRVNKSALDEKDILDSDDYVSVHDEYIRLKKDFSNSLAEETRRASTAEETLSKQLSSITKEQIGLSHVENKDSATIRSELTKDNITSALGYTPDTPEEIDEKLSTNIKTYTDTKITDLINGAPSTLDTLGEIADAMTENQSVVEAINSAIGTKVDKMEGKGLSTEDYTTEEKNKLEGVSSGAEVNQNAFSNITVDSTAITAGSKTDTLALTSGSNVTITPDAAGKKITISSKDSVYTHPATSGNKHIPAGGSSGQILKWESDGTATWGDMDDLTNHTHSYLPLSGGTVSGDIILNGALLANRICSGYDPGVTGSISCSNWFRSSGDTGWYNASHNVGIYSHTNGWVGTYPFNNTANFSSGGTICSAGIGRFGQFEAQYGNTNMIMRNDSATFYMLPGTTAGWNGTYPLNINMTNGAVTMGTPVTMTSTVAMTSTLGVNGRATVGSLQVCDGNVSTSAANCRFTTGSETGIIRQASSSSKRYKHDITKDLSADLAPDRLYDLNIYQYKYNGDYLSSDDIRYLKDVIGLIAEDVYEKYPVAADYYIDEDGELIIEDWVDRFLIPPMLALIQKQHKEIEEQKLASGRQDALIRELIDRIDRLEGDQ